MSAGLEQKCRQLVVELGLGAAEDVTEIRPLTGGVASDIARVRLNGRDICAKFALSRLKVAENWQAPVHRNAAEYSWLAVAADLFPDSGVKLFGRSEAQHGFAMEYLSGDDVYLWKTALLAEHPDRGEARAVGDMLGRIHAVSARPGFDTGPFQNRDDFRALRIEPYLTFTAGRHPELPAITSLADVLYGSAQVLVHGDVSPKNILFRGGAPILLDAECATMGDASFDPAFCLNHLVLKATHLPASRARYLQSVTDFWHAYAPHVTWEAQAELEARVCRLVPALMLARVDGKSPVEYLGGHEQATVRQISTQLIREPAETLETLVSRLNSNMKGMNT